MTLWVWEGRWREGGLYAGVGRREGGLHAHK